MTRVAALVGLTLVLSLVVRMPRLNTFITSDEMNWVCRSLRFRQAIATGDLAGTYQTGHPGVLTMLVGALAIQFDPQTEWASRCLDAKEPDLEGIATRYGPTAIHPYATALFEGRAGAAIATSLLTGLIVLLTWRVFGGWTAVWAGALLVFDPFFAALSRQLHLDALMACLSLISLLCLLVWRAEWMKGNSSRGLVWIVASAIAAALAVLTKLSAALIAPMMLLVVAGTWLWPARRSSDWRTQLLHAAQGAALWSLVAVLTFVICWPALWTAPIATLLEMFDTAGNYVAVPHSNNSFFLGSIVADPGPLFYPLVWLFRTTAVVWIGLVLAALDLAVHRTQKPDAGDSTGRAAGIAILVVFAGMVAVAMTLGPRKYDRYLLPSILALDLVAAAGWAYLTVAVGRLAANLNHRYRGHRLVRASQLALLVLVMAAQAALILPSFPYFSLYYNPFLGGVPAAREVFLLGSGEGLDLAAGYLNRLPDAPSQSAVTWNVVEFAPLYRGWTRDVDAKDGMQADYIVLHVGQAQRLLKPPTLAPYLAGERPEFVARIGGVDFAYVYRNAARSSAAASRRVAATGEP